MGATSAAPSQVLTIDLGTSGPKAALFEMDGTYVDGAFAPVKMLLDEGGQAEQRPADWWAGIRSACAELRSRGSLEPAKVRAISVTSQWSGTVPVDERLEPVFNAITWMDSRGADAVKARFGGPVAGYSPTKIRHLLRLTGGAPSMSGKDPVGHILWFEQAHPHLAAATRLYLEPKDWLNAKLTGRAVATYDSIVLHWLTDNRNPSRVSYAPELLSMAGIDRAKLPELIPATTVVGPLTAEAAADLGLAPGIEVVGGTPDVQSAAIGSGAVRDFEPHLYIGTSSWLTCHVPFKKTDLLTSVASLPSPLPGKYFVANEQEVAGATLNWLRDNVLFPGDALAAPTDEEAVADAFRLIDEVASTSPPGANGLIFTPWLNGERTPVDDHTCRGGWFNMSLRSNRADMVRAVLEGVAYNSRWLMGSVEKFVGAPFDWINMIGGGATSDLWCQIHADILGREIRQVENPIRANARGAALLAALTLGETTVDEIASRRTVAKVFYPDPARRELHDSVFAEFLRIYRQNKKTWRRLNRH